MTTSYFFVSFTGRATIDEAARALKAAKLPVQQKGSQLKVDYSGVAFTIGLNDEAHVGLESKEFAKTHRAADLADHTRRFEVEVADLELALHETTTLMIIQQTLLELTQGVVWLQWNDALIRHD